MICNTVLDSQLANLVSPRFSPWVHQWTLRWAGAITLTGLNAIRFSNKDLQSKTPSEMCYQSSIIVEVETKEKIKSSEQQTIKIIINYLLTEIITFIIILMCLVWTEHWSKLCVCVYVCICLFNSLKTHIKYKFYPYDH